MIKNQLESSGLFAVNLQSTEWVQYSKDRSADVYPAYQLGFFPDYSDTNDWLAPLFGEGSFLNNHYDNPTVKAEILQQAVTIDKAERTNLIKDIQAKVAADLSTVPLLQGSQIAITGAGITGTGDTMDASYKFRYAALAKG
jgi:peptide/nickel transport system substrate-binding protein